MPTKIVVVGYSLPARQLISTRDLVCNFFKAQIVIISQIQ